MAKVYLGLGSNLGDRHGQLRQALEKLEPLSDSRIKVSPSYETRALLPEGAPLSWNQHFINLAVEMSYSDSPQSLLEEIQKIESQLGRIRSQKWEPRPVDIDILCFEGHRLSSPNLTLPHPEAHKRSFVLAPLKDLNPDLRLSQSQPSVLELYRGNVDPNPAFMGILNVTPDSFSDGGEYQNVADIETYFKKIDGRISLVDLGAESTRPGARPLHWKEEWSRMEPVLKWYKTHFYKNTLRPILSVDTRHGEVAARALEFGAEYINDVSGLKCPVMKELLPQADCTYIFMHSLSIPADKSKVFPEDTDVVSEVYKDAEIRLRQLEDLGISRRRIVFDPGIGFGKTAFQSLNLIKNVQRFWGLNCRILIGHSRKSFLNLVTARPFKDRDPESIGISLKLANEKVDILRVHEPIDHLQAFRAYRLVQEP